jgi:hypothetical protein
MFNQVPGEFQTAKPFDLEESQKLIGSAVIGIVTLSLAKQETIDHETSVKVWSDIREAITAGAYACSEIRRMRDEITELRDSHRPRPHADPSRPGALCAACSLDGALISWPCQVWTAADRILTQGQP